MGIVKDNTGTHHSYVRTPVPTGPKNALMRLETIGTIEGDKEEILRRLRWERIMIVAFLCGPPEKRLKGRPAKAGTSPRFYMSITELAAERKPGLLDRKTIRACLTAWFDVAGMPEVDSRDIMLPDIPVPQWRAAQEEELEPELDDDERDERDDDELDDDDERDERDDDELDDDEQGTGEEDDRPEDKRKPERKPQPKPKPPTPEEMNSKDQASATHMFTIRAASDMAYLSGYPILWQYLTDGDMRRLAETAKMIETIQQGAKSCKTTSKKPSTRPNLRAV